MNLKLKSFFFFAICAARPVDFNADTLNALPSKFNEKIKILKKIVFFKITHFL